jgi:hypothetical protein
MDGPVGALAVGPDGTVYAGGTFGSAGGVPAHHAARWDGTAWQPLGTGVDGSVYALALIEPGRLVLGGGFPSAGGVYSPYVTLYTEGPVATSGDGPPAAYVLDAPHPNPASGIVAIRFTAPSAGPVTVDVFDVLGRQVATLFDRAASAGSHTATWDASGAAPGVYVVRLVAGTTVRSARLVVAR